MSSFSSSLRDNDVMAMRQETDSLGIVNLPKEALWGAQTERSRQFFKIGDELMPMDIIYALIIIKRTAARVNGMYGWIKGDIADAIVRACDTLLENFEDYRTQFPLNVFQTGSGTQTNMNVNEVIANIANIALGGELGSKTPVHPNDHVNYGQSSNDSFPTAMNIAIVRMMHDQVLPALNYLQKHFEEKAHAFGQTLKIARTHLQDATPMTVAQEWGAFAHQLRLCGRRITQALEDVRYLAQGGTAVGTGLNTHEGFAEHFIEQLNIFFDQKYDFQTADNKCEALATHDSLVYLSGALNTLAVALLKIGNDIRLLGSGPRAGLNELLLPENEPGSSIMPGKVNPTQAESITMVAAAVMGLHTTVSVAGSQGHLQLNVFKPVIAQSILRAGQLLSDSMISFATHCISGTELHHDQLSYNIEHSLMVATALNTVIGYDNAAKAAKKANKEGLSLKQSVLDLGFLSEDAYNKHIIPLDMTHPFHD